MNERNLTHVRRRYILSQRFAAGLRDMVFYHRAKALILLAYTLAVTLIWVNRAKVLMPLFDGDSLVYHSVSLALLLVAVLLLGRIIVAMGTPRRATKIQEALMAAGFTDSTRMPPLLLSMRRTKPLGYVYEFDPNHIPLSRWEQDKEKIGAALHCCVMTLKLSTDGGRVLVRAVPVRFSLPEKVYWKDEYLSPEDFTLALGMNMLRKAETINLASTPHILLGGGTGSGKSWLLKSLLMQSLKKGAIVIIADFKGGVDYAPIWHKKCQMVFNPGDLKNVLGELCAELERRRDLFVKAGVPNLAEYNRTMGEKLPRYLFACDEVAEVLDSTGLSKAEKEPFAQIVGHLSLIARQGRAFGIHLILATQRPDAALIPGQIRTNLTLRICGRADNILSRIILDDSSAAEKIPLDAKGRFVTNLGQSFQGFLFDDSSL